MIRTSRVREVLRINDWVVEGVRGVDPQTALAERVLERRLDGDRVRALWRASQTEQNLNLSDGGGEESGSGIVDGLVPGNDRGVLAGDKGGGGGFDSAGGVLDERLERVVAEQGRDVGVACRRVDVREERVRLAVRVGLVVEIYQHDQR